MRFLGRGGFPFLSTTSRTSDKIEKNLAIIAKTLNIICFICIIIMVVAMSSENANVYD